MLQTPSFLRHFGWFLILLKKYFPGHPSISYIPKARVNVLIAEDDVRPVPMWSHNLQPRYRRESSRIYRFFQCFFKKKSWKSKKCEKIAPEARFFHIFLIFMIFSNFFLSFFIIFFALFPIVRECSIPYVLVPIAWHEKTYKKHEKHEKNMKKTWKITKNHEKIMK